MYTLTKKQASASSSTVRQLTLNWLENSEMSATCFNVRNCTWKNAVWNGPSFYLLLDKKMHF